MRIKPCDWAKLHNVSPQRTYALINKGRFRSACLEADGFQAPSNDTITCSADCASAWEDLSPPSNPPKPTPKSDQSGRRAKVWILVDPTGQEHIVRNLRQWSEDNVALFFDSPDSDSARKLEYYIRDISVKLRRGLPLSYKGWTLKGPPAYSPD